MSFHICCFRYLFWTDWGDKPKIQRATMDGKNIKDIVTTNIHWPNGLTIDYDTDTLYFADAYKGRIDQCNLDGKERKVSLEFSFHMKLLKCCVRNCLLKSVLLPLNGNSTIFQKVQILYPLHLGGRQKSEGQQFLKNLKQAREYLFKVKNKNSILTHFSLVLHFCTP